jgi:hypothetical protein
LLVIRIGYIATEDGWSKTSDEIFARCYAVVVAS